MTRYLLFISYVGSGFSGAQKNYGVKTVAGVLEGALNALRPSNDVNVSLSSRTDKGVNALCNTLHVDLYGRNDETFNENEITKCVNTQMYEANEPLRVVKTMKVRNDFHSRYNAIARTYIYRIAIPKSTKVVENYVWNPFDETIHVCNQTMDISDIKKCVKKLSGTHDFTAFTRYAYLESWRNPVKTVDISINPSSHDSFHYSILSNNYDLLEFKFSSHSFLYRQIIKMVGMIFDIATSKYELDLIDHMFSFPRVYGAHHFKDVSPQALFLQNVIYNENDLTF